MALPAVKLVCIGTAQAVIGMLGYKNVMIAGIATSNTRIRKLVIVGSFLYRSKYVLFPQLTQLH